MLIAKILLCLYFVAMSYVGFIASVGLKENGSKLENKLYAVGSVLGELIGLLGAILILFV